MKTWSTLYQSLNSGGGVPILGILCTSALNKLGGFSHTHTLAHSILDGKVGSTLLWTNWEKSVIENGATMRFLRWCLRGNEERGADLP